MHRLVLYFRIVGEKPQRRTNKSLCLTNSDLSQCCLKRQHCCSFVIYFVGAWRVSLKFWSTLSLSIFVVSEKLRGLSKIDSPIFRMFSSLNLLNYSNTRQTFISVPFFFFFIITHMLFYSRFARNLRSAIHYIWSFNHVY